MALLENTKCWGRFRTKVNRITLGALILFSVSAQAKSDFRFDPADYPVIDLATDLGGQGNASVATRFRDFERQNKGCLATNGGRRILLTGFGRFSHLNQNTSGAVIGNLVNEAFWPNNFSLANPPVPDATYEVLAAQLSKSDGGARIVNRSLVVDGKEVSLCLVEVDVLWDFAAAVIVTEMNRFQPDSVVMTGLGDREPIVEAGATNQTSNGSGYYPDGSGDFKNRPKSPRVLNDLPWKAALPMTWSQKELAQKISGLVQTQGYEIQVPSRARKTNDYICNNVSFVALAAAAGKTVSLAGGKLKIESKITSHPRVGFFHFPQGIPMTTKSLHAWAEILFNLVL